MLQGIGSQRGFAGNVEPVKSSQLEKPRTRSQEQRASMASASAFDDAVASFLLRETRTAKVSPGGPPPGTRDTAASQTTPPRPPPAAVTPSTSGSVHSLSLSTGGRWPKPSRVGRSRQQLAPRFLDYSEIDVTTPSPVLRSDVDSNAATVPVSPSPTQFYAVARGRRIGVYNTITEVYEETDGYDYCVYRLCESRREAEQFIDRYLDITQGRRYDPDPRHRSTLVAFCDGVTQDKRNWSHQTGVACIFPHNSAWDVVYTCQDAYCTAYRATAKSALAAIRRANNENPAQDQVLYIYTRNQLLVRAMTEWMDKWLLNDWRKGDGHPVKNRDVLQEIVEAQGTRRVIWRYEDGWVSEWTASAVSAAKDASICFGVSCQ